MFNYKHYVPILRWKKAEQEALRLLNAQQKLNITPLIELVPLSERINQKTGQITKSKEEVLTEAIAALPDKILSSWGQDPFFIDVSEVIMSFQFNAINYIVPKSIELGINIVPVIHLSSDPELIHTIIKKNTLQRICLRLFERDLQNQNLNQLIDSLITTYNLDIRNIDLLIDFKYITTKQTDNWVRLSSNIPYLSQWHTFTIASGSFTKDLSSFDPDYEGRHELKREDWLSWLPFTEVPQISRQPSYADYTIQHAIWYDNGKFSPSASIRYSYYDFWIIMRGRKISLEGSQQYLANAYFLSRMKEFLGENFSSGDAYIFEKAKDIHSTHTGRAQDWLQAGINHHISLVIHQIANLPD